MLDATEWVVDDHVNIDDVFLRLTRETPPTQDMQGQDTVAPEELTPGVGCILSKAAFTKLLDATDPTSTCHTFENRGYYIRIAGDGSERLLVWYDKGPTKGGDMQYFCRILTPDECKDIYPCYLEPYSPPTPNPAPSRESTPAAAASIRRHLAAALEAEAQRHGEF